MKKGKKQKLKKVKIKAKDLEVQFKDAMKKGEKEDKLKTVNKEAVLEEKVFKALQRAAKGVAKIGKVKYNKITVRSRKDADKSKQIINILVKRVYVVEILLRDYLMEVNK
jgi:hypothetical protein